MLVVDEERAMRRAALLLSAKAEVTSREGRTRSTSGTSSPDLVVSDARMQDLDGLEVLRHARQINPSVIAIIVTAYGPPDLLRGVAQLGVNDYVEKPFNTEVLRYRIRKELDRKRLQQENVLLKKAMHTANQFDNIIGNSSAMLQVFEMVETIAPTSSTVLITGESGTGKELVARAIHVRSPRSDRPFVAVNCGALTETLLDSELFGHMRGSFTGADGNRKGLIEVADKGTIFLDEIGEMSPMLQVKILRVLQERKFRRVGGNEEVEADIRIIAATNRDLSKMVAEGQFREDLFYRLNVIPVRLPSLREDRGSAARRPFRSPVRRADEKPIMGITGAALVRLQAHSGPQRLELENAMERPSPGRTPSILPESSRTPRASNVGGRAARRRLAAGGSTSASLPERLDSSSTSRNLERDHRQALAARTVKSSAELLAELRSFRYT